MSEQAVKWIVTPDPPIGSKVHVVEEKGLINLHVGQGIFRSMNCTHAGTGSWEVYDGVPSPDGFFPGEKLMRPTMGDELYEIMGKDPKWADHPLWIEYKADPFWTRNGRPLYRAHPIVMGCWMLDAGYLHGLTVKAGGGTENNNAIGKVVWHEHRAKAAK